jgi:hypothetical protein
VPITAGTHGALDAFRADTVYRDPKLLLTTPPYGCAVPNVINALAWFRPPGNTLATRGIPKIVGVVPSQVFMVNETRNSFVTELGTESGVTLPDAGVGLIFKGVPTLPIVAYTFVANVTFLLINIDKLFLGSNESNEYPVYRFPSVVESVTPFEIIVSVVPVIDGEIRHPISLYTMILLSVRGVADNTPFARMLRIEIFCGAVNVYTFPTRENATLVVLLKI